MSWSLDFNGNAATIRTQFSAKADEAKANGMNDGEVADIRQAGEYVADLANRHGVLSGSASGYWQGISIPGQPPQQLFNKLNLSISLASTT